jgi:ABC-type multidrug transport system ATPase subunit
LLGDIDVLNDQESVRKILGYLPQEFGVYPRTSAVDLLEHLAILKGFSNGSERKDMVDQLLNKVNLYEHRKKAVSSYSGGMRQRFGIAQALLGDPKLLIVDEPTAGLDPGERNRFYNLLSEVGESVVVILSTHIVEDVQELCTNMSIINRGRLLFAGSPSQAESSLAGRIWAKSMSKEELKKCQTEMDVISNKLIEGRPMVRVYSDSRPGEGFSPIDPNLEDIFFYQIKRNSNVA